jgi:hypothetical protein
MSDYNKYDKPSKDDHDVTTAFLMGGAIVLIIIFGLKSWVQENQLEQLQKQHESYRQGVVEGQIR